VTPARTPSRGVAVRGREWIAWALALALVTALLVAFRAHLNEAHITLAYLLLVQGGSARGGRALGVALSIGAFLCFDLFLLPPYGALTIQNPLNWLVLLAFLATSLISAELLFRAQAERAAALEDAHRAKDQVLASVSHDLRTPLTTIKGLAHELASTGDDRAIVIEEEADRLTELVGQLLDLSRLTSGSSIVNTQPNEAEDLLGAAAQRVAGRLDGHELRIAVANDDALLFGRFDFSQTLRALVNLIENAAKYSPSGEPIDLAARRAEKWLEFSVADRGPGVPQEERTKIFEPYYRRPGVAPDAGGAGLGLSIARGIAEAQGGELEVDEREGGGSVFRLRVPAIVTMGSAE
jgi:two-component system sensor histidine kinase KdpD